MATRDQENPRDHQRQRVLKGGQIILESLTSTIDVVLRDLSEGGAKLKLAQPTPLPDRFLLRIHGSAINTAQTYYCEKRWQRADLVGVSFTPKPVEEELPSNPAADPSASRRYRLLKPGSTLFQER